MPILQHARDYVRSFETIRLGATRRDRVQILRSRLRLLLYPVDRLCFLWFHRPFLESKNGVICCRSDGLTFFCASDRSPEMLLRSYEPEIWAELRQVTEGDFIDVGASIGAFCVRMARRLEGRGRVVAIEPNPTSANLLARTISHNHLTNLQLVRAAAWSEKGTLTLYQHVLGGPPVDNSVVFRVSDRSHQVPAVTIDDIVETQALKNVAFVKIDAEGAEPEILRGMGRTLSRFPDLRIIFETLSPDMIEACRDILAASGFGTRAIPSMGSVRTFVASRSGD